MEDVGLLITMAIVLGIALVGAMIAGRLKLPLIVGYLAGGMIIGPFGFRLVGNVEQVETLATIGVILLMFTLGLEFSRKTLRRIGKIAVFGGISQILVTIGLGLLVGWALDFDFAEAMLFGFFIALSSTIVVLKLLMARGELGSAHGRVMIGILLIQDLSVVPMMLILTWLGAPDGGAGIPAWVLTKAAIFLAVVLGLGFWALPKLMRRVASARSRETFLLAVVVLSLGAAFAANYVGLSMALGAFLAGLIASESEYAQQALADVRPLRDIFAVLFFVSLGMLADPRFIVENPGLVAMVVGAIVLGKGLIIAAITRVFGYSSKTTLFTGSGLFQIGEFSFVLAALALQLGLIAGSTYVLTITAAVITIVMTPFSLGFVSWAYHRLVQVPGLSKMLTMGVDPGVIEEGKQLSNHVVICGYGRMARHLVQVLQRRSFSCLVVDIDPRVIDLTHRREIPSIYGDASNRDILARAGLERARVLVIAFPDPIAARLAIEQARSINPRIDIVARVHRVEDRDLLREKGVAEMVHPEVEAGLEIIRHTLHRFGLTGQEIQYIIQTLREEELESAA
ncbi:MAG: cation:proton antiporter [Dehalococcoidia bacterium]|nr:cation:proton antiporter [Dehalococcoidia bacterium]